MELMINWNNHKPADFKYRGRWIDNWFSNMRSCLIAEEINGKVVHWPSAENRYQAGKTKGDKSIFFTCTPAEAKRYGRKVDLRPDWEEVKEEVMLSTLRLKFDQHRLLKAQLVTDKNFLIEWNNWGDTYWGVDVRTGRGMNRLGFLLELVRYECLR